MDSWQEKQLLRELKALALISLIIGMAAGTVIGYMLKGYLG